MATATQAHVGHRSFINDIITHHGLNYLDNPMDSIPSIRVWDRVYKVDSYSMDPENNDAGVPALNEPGITVYTDGSKKEDKTGAGIVFYEAGTPIERKGQALFYASRLLGSNSVFQAEVWAIKKATELMLEQLDDPQPDALVCADSADPLCAYTQRGVQRRSAAVPVRKGSASRSPE